jgi:hypothetical protein
VKKEAARALSGLEVVTSFERCPTRGITGTMCCLGNPSFKEEWGLLAVAWTKLAEEAKARSRAS